MSFNFSSGISNLYRQVAQEQIAANKGIVEAVLAGEAAAAPKPAAPRPASVATLRPYSLSSAVLEPGSGLTPAQIDQKQSTWDSFTKGITQLPGALAEAVTRPEVLMLGAMGAAQMAAQPSGSSSLGAGETVGNTSAARWGDSAGAIQSGSMIPAGAPGAMIYSGATGAPVLTPAPMPQIALPDKTETTKGEGEAPPAEAPPAEAPPAEAPPAEAPPAEAPPAKDIGRADIDGPDLEIYNVGNESLANVNSLQYEGIANKVGGPDSDIYNIGLDTPLNVQSPTGPSTLPSANTSSAGPLDKQLVQKSEAPPAENWREQITSPFKKAIGNTGKSDIAKVPLTLPPNMPAQPSRIQNARKPAAEVPRNPWGDLSVSQPAQRPIEAPPAKSIDSTLEKGIGEVPLNTGNEPYTPPAEPGKIENVLKPAAEVPRNPLPAGVSTDDSAGESGGGDARGSDGGGGGDSIWGELGAAAITGALGLIGQHQADKAADKATEAQMQIYREQQERYNRLYGPIEENLANYYNTVTPKSATAQHLQQYQAEYQKQMKRFTETAAQRGVSETAQMAMKQQAELGSAAARAQIRYDTPQALRQSQQGFLALGAGLDTAAATGLSNMYGQQAQQAREAQTAGWNMFGNALGSALSTYAQRPKTSASQGTLLTG